jgi:hypothetical protein
VKNSVDEEKQALEAECERLKMREKQLLTEMKKKGDLARQMLVAKDEELQAIRSVGASPAPGHENNHALQGKIEKSPSNTSIAVATPPDGGPPAVNMSVGIIAPSALGSGRPPRNSMNSMSASPAVVECTPPRNARHEVGCSLDDSLVYSYPVLTNRYR